MFHELQQIIEQQKEAVALLDCNAVIIQQVGGGVYAPEVALGMVRDMDKELQAMEHRTLESLTEFQVMLESIVNDLGVARSAIKAKVRDLEIAQISPQKRGFKSAVEARHSPVKL